MGQPTFAKATVGKRSRPRAYLLLARISNLPTIWTNVLAAYVVAGAARESLPTASIAASLFYTAGMFLNDAFDAPFDAQARADRPIPNGDVSRNEVFAAGIALMLAGEGLLAFMPHRTPALLWGVALAIAIVFYDYLHKGKAFGPIVMGACRALVYCVAAAGAVGLVPAAVAIAAVIMWIYIIGLTWVAKTAGLGHHVPVLLAGICFVDAAMIVFSGEPRLAIIAATGFALTLAFQRVVPGT
ncbi:MAG TPA: UbiA family prenyltransferase [Vicinamibacterales bacterium]|nr:UbiA family prenyltransferase [Vicinamibacterales bacterium]